MCRMAAYLGPPISLRQFLYTPAHSLFEQALHPRELRFTHLNVDGFGFGWYPADQQPAVYVNAMPIGSDPNLSHLARSLTSGLWLANVRSATAGLAVHHANTQPFTADGILFLHNGFISDFAQTMRPLMHERLDAHVQAQIQGNTDSEYLFALLRQNLDQEDQLEAAIGACLDQLETWAGATPCLLNFIISDGRSLIAVRHALNEQCPSLYYISDDEQFPAAELVASEKLTDADYWQAVPEHSLVVFTPDQPPELHSL